MLDNMQTKNLGILYRKLNMLWLQGKITKEQEILVHNIAREFELRGYDMPDFCEKLTMQDIEKLQKGVFSYNGK